MLVACDNESAKAKAATAFDDLGRTVDENNFFGQFGTTASGATLIAAFTGRTARSAGARAAGTLTTRATISTATARSTTTRAARAACICVCFCHSFFFRLLSLIRAES